MDPASVAIRAENPERGPGNKRGGHGLAPPQRNRPGAYDARDRRSSGRRAGMVRGAGTFVPEVVRRLRLRMPAVNLLAYYGKLLDISKRDPRFALAHRQGFVC